MDESPQLLWLSPYDYGWFSCLGFYNHTHNKFSCKEEKQHLLNMENKTTIEGIYSEESIWAAQRAANSTHIHHMKAYKEQPGRNAVAVAGRTSKNVDTPTRSTDESRTHARRRRNWNWSSRLVEAPTTPLLTELEVGRSRRADVSPWTRSANTAEVTVSAWIGSLTIQCFW
jgi:hypothetical protein